MAIIAPDIGIDLGTANTQVYVKRKSILVDEPSLLVVDRDGRHAIRAIGEEARVLLGRIGGDVTAVRPLSDGMIRDFDMTQYMLQYFVRKAIGASRLIKPRAVMTVPCRISPIERRAVRRAAIYAGVRDGQLHLVEKPFAAAVGSGLPIFEPYGSMVVDIGGGTTEAAVISLGGVVASRSIRIGGVKMDEAIIAYVRREFNMLIGDRTAEDVKMTLGAALPLKEAAGAGAGPGYHHQPAPDGRTEFHPGLRGPALPLRGHPFGHSGGPGTHAARTGGGRDEIGHPPDGGRRTAFRLGPVYCLRTGYARAPGQGPHELRGHGRGLPDRPSRAAQPHQQAQLPS